MVSQLHNSTTLEIMNSTYINNKSEYYGSAVCFKELAELLSALLNTMYDDNVVQISDCIFNYNNKQVYLTLVVEQLVQ